MTCELLNKSVSFQGSRNFLNGQDKLLERHKFSDFTENEFQLDWHSVKNKAFHLYFPSQDRSRTCPFEISEMGAYSISMTTLSLYGIAYTLILTSQFTGHRIERNTLSLYQLFVIQSQDSSYQKSKQTSIGHLKSGQFVFWSFGVS